MESQCQDAQNVWWARAGWVVLQRFTLLLSAACLHYFTSPKLAQVTRAAVPLSDGGSKYPVLQCLLDINSSHGRNILEKALQFHFVLSVLPVCKRRQCLSGIALHMLQTACEPKSPTVNFCMKLTG